VPPTPGSGCPSYRLVRRLKEQGGLREGPIPAGYTGPIQGVDGIKGAGRVWELRHNVTPYDAAYLALAEERGCRLVTTHGKLRDCPGRRCDVHVVTPGR
jgi:hypothetical protein